MLTKISVPDLEKILEILGPPYKATLEVYNLSMLSTLINEVKEVYPIEEGENNYASFVPPQKISVDVKYPNDKQLVKIYRGPIQQGGVSQVGDFRQAELSQKEQARLKLVQVYWGITETDRCYGVYAELKLSENPNMALIYGESNSIQKKVSPEPIKKLLDAMSDMHLDFAITSKQ